MSNLLVFVCGIVVTLIVGMGVITSQVFLGYKETNKQDDELEYVFEELNNA